MLAGSIEDASAWGIADAPPALEHGQVHLWLADLQLSEKQFKFCESCLDLRERKRAARYSHPDARFRYVCARGVLKQILSRYLACDSRKISFRLGELGKPYLDPHLHLHPAIQFNATDSGMLALYALCLSSEIGIDIELADRKVRHDLIAPRRFSAHELSRYRRFSDPEQRRMTFLSVWTRKEAYGKAKGVGIAYPMKEVNLVDDDAWTQTRIIDADGLPMEITPMASSCRFVASVAVSGSGWRYLGFRLLPESLRLRD